MIRFIFLLGFSIFFWSCEEVAPIKPAFYHWQTEVSLDQSEQQFMTQLQTQRLYVKFFDVDWNFNKKLPVPLASAQLDTQSLQSLKEIIPTIFITNRTFTHLPSEDIPKLADRIDQKIKTLSPSTTAIPEIQIDCDWTKSTRSKYFQFLEILKSKWQKQSILLSTTIRLHQIKYYESTGVPPVDRGMLMFYNMGDLEKWKEPNSILNIPTAQQYISRLDEYPLPLDLALPLYSWGVAFRGDQFLKLINQLEAADLEGNESMVKIAPNRFKLIKSSYIQGYYLYKGDQIRLEHCKIDSLQKSAQILAAAFRQKPRFLTFYHLDSAVIKHFSYDQLENICSTFD